MIKIFSKNRETGVNELYFYAVADADADADADVDDSGLRDLSILAENAGRGEGEADYRNKNHSVAAIGGMIARGEYWYAEDMEGRRIGGSVMLSRNDWYLDSFLDNAEIAFKALKAQSEIIERMESRLRRDYVRGANKPSKAAKMAGLETLQELSEFSGESVQTLNNWFKNYPRRFGLLLKAVSLEKRNHV